MQYPLGEATGRQRYRATVRGDDADERSLRASPRCACCAMRSDVFLEAFYPSKRVHNTRDESKCHLSVRPPSVSVSPSRP